MQTEPAELTTPPGEPPGGGGRLLRFGRRRARLLLLVSAVILTVAAAVGLWAHAQIDPSGSPGPVAVVSIPEGSSTSRIASTLAQNGVIKNSLLFRIYLRLDGDGPFRAGVYALHRHESYGAAVRELQGATLTDRLTIPEGFTLQQIADRVGAVPGHSAAGFLAAASSGQVHSPYGPTGSTNLEGLLFPDTYLVPRGESDAQILQMMVDRFDKVAAEVGLDQAPTTVGVS
ncbi:MAG TPA: endolytic transglycosylase MltG, partial [Acidimicrobiales bacterium]|nr:endolytic transglycosylase MltG [Acidimicrobiales bacterium]